MTTELRSDFAAHKWCQDLLSSPDLVVDERQTRRPPPPAEKDVTHSLTSQTLRSERTIRAWTSLSSKHTLKPHAGPECYLLLSLGTGLDGYRGIMHGGMFGLLMDQVSTMAAFKAGGPGLLTAELTVSYLRSVLLPAVVLCRAVATQVEGRKVWVEGSIEDGKGTQYCRAKALCIVQRLTKL